MQRITITLDDDLMKDLDAMIATHGYQNRSEAIRDLTRAGMQQAVQDKGRARTSPANASRRWSMFTTTPRATCRGGWSIPITITTISRWRRCMCISTTTTAWR
jgi:Arc/MetJ-type ribon-helix-helix transcriptional regulator